MAENNPFEKRFKEKEEKKLRIVAIVLFIPLCILFGVLGEYQNYSPWVLRFLCFILAFASLAFLTRRKSSLDGLLYALFGAAGIALVVISVPWILRKWYIGVPMLVVGIGILVLYILIIRGRIKLKKEKPEKTGSLFI